MSHTLSYVSCSSSRCQAEIPRIPGRIFFSRALFYDGSNNLIETRRRRRCAILSLPCGLLSLRLIARQHGSQKSEFGFHFCGIGNSIRDFLSKEFAISLAKPVNRNFERSL
jgi:hypothetical protein